MSNNRYMEGYCKALNDVINLLDVSKKEFQESNDSGSIREKIYVGVAKDVVDIISDNIKKLENYFNGVLRG